MAEAAPVPPTWTMETLYVHLTALIASNDARYLERFISMDARFHAALEANRQALYITAESAEKWRMAANEWRGAMDDRERGLMPRSLAEQHYNTLNDKIGDLLTRIEGTIEPLRKDIQTIREQQSQQRGSATTAAAIFAGAIAVLGLIITVVFKLWN